MNHDNIYAIRLREARMKAHIARPMRQQRHQSQHTVKTGWLIIAAIAFYTVAALAVFG